MAIPAQRLVSLLPAATEMAFALGLGDRVLAVSHECDYPNAVRSLPRLTRPTLDLEGLGQAQIDEAVSAQLASGSSLYAIDEALLRRLGPDLILTQNLCAVCAPSNLELEPLATRLDPVPRILWLSPSSIQDIFDNLRAVAEATDREAQAETLIAGMQGKIADIAARLAGAPRRRVVFLEWVDPVYGAGHWVPEMVRLAGGEDPLGRPGRDSVRIAWDAVLEAAPEVLIVSPCGLDLERAKIEAAALAARPGWSRLPAVRQGLVFAVDANAYFARPGPRVVEGVALLAHLLHPDRVAWTGPDDAFAPLASALHA
ncbi:MAG: cobalamin-binding protein [Alphaproteobacteria bacterium]|nr:cobalamin-binding protein [Alphaproteobacteria bacterium]